MSVGYEVYDNERVQLMTRKHAAALTGLTAGMLVLTAAVFAVGDLYAAPLPAVALLLSAAWFCTIHIIATRLRHLRRVVWCIKLSDRKIVGYDYTRRKVALDWLSVRRVDLTHSGFLIVGQESASLEISHLFPDFPKLSHRIVEYAESYGIPVFIDGQPWQNLNVYEVFPFLEAADNTPGHWH